MRRIYNSGTARSVTRSLAPDGRRSRKCHCAVSILSFMEERPPDASLFLFIFTLIRQTTGRRAKVKRKWRRRWMKKKKPGAPHQRVESPGFCSFSFLARRVGRDVDHLTVDAEAQITALKMPLPTIWRDHTFPCCHQADLLCLTYWVLKNVSRDDSGLLFILLLFFFWLVLSDERAPVVNQTSIVKKKGAVTK